MFYLNNYFVFQRQHVAEAKSLQSVVEWWKFLSSIQPPLVKLEALPRT